MNAHLIISEEYKMNSPSIFIFAKGKYYGSLLYPQIRNFPEDVNYWKTAMSSDHGRGFFVKKVQYSKDEFAKIQSLQNEISETSKMLKIYHGTAYIPKPDAPKNSKVYKNYIANMHEQIILQQEINEHNKPFDAVIFAKRDELRKLILSAINDEN